MLWLDLRRFLHESLPLTKKMTQGTNIDAVLVDVSRPRTDRSRIVAWLKIPNTTNLSIGIQHRILELRCSSRSAAGMA